MASMFSTFEAFDIAFRFLSTSVSLAGILMLIRSLASEVILDKLRSYFFSFLDYLSSFFHYLFNCCSTNLTLVINERDNMSRNEVYDAAELYLPTKIGPKTKRLRLSKTKSEENFALSMANGEEIVDIFEEIQLKWRYICHRIQNRDGFTEEKIFVLSFRNKFKDQVVGVYLPHVLARAEQIKEQNKVVKIHSVGSRKPPRWSSAILEHPATFDTVAMPPEQKKMIIDDLERFLNRRAFFKSVGKAWKRGYLLYGPPGTGKSSLIAAMANYLKFHIYDLELASIKSNSELRELLLSTTSRSILVIEDIDCGIQVQDRKIQSESDDSYERLTLSGTLNLIDGLWSSCGGERVIVFTTNHKDRLDPALLRPGRMDVHVNMSYCRVDAFKILASNYLDISNHPLFGEIESLIESKEVTPAEVAGELMRSEDADVALQELLKFIKEKSECDEIGGQVAEIEEANSLKSDNKEKEIGGGWGQDRNTK
ncbi:hypothetical protein SLEP1_g38511 [Rubroshorea leprosula]|nr:hypothetical protein SLEP1_g38511 [Rubroshorea leprosula]